MGAGGPSIEAVLAEIERQRDGTPPGSTDLRFLRRLALTACQTLHVRPGETVWELGAGGGAWTAAVAEAMGSDVRVVGIVADEDLHRRASTATKSYVTFLHAPLLETVGGQQCDYIIGRSLLRHADAELVWEHVLRLLKPGGQCLFFEDNLQHPAAACSNALKRLCGVAWRDGSMEGVSWLARATRGKVPGVQVRPYGLGNLCRPGRPAAWLLGVLEAAPGIRWLTRTVAVSGAAAGEKQKSRAGLLATRTRMFDSTSVVIPCRNEAANLPVLVDGLISLFDPYIHEIVIVNDNSSDDTGAIADRLAQTEPRVRAVHRKPPGGVGRALRDGYAAATGRYILSMDADFGGMLPELQGLFEAVSNGSDGAIGSRFTPGSVLLGYPLGKLICNRAAHLVLKILVNGRIRDISNNLKLYRSEIFKTMDLRSDTFAANLETGLKPMLSGYKITEVPVSWVNRTADMGSSSFKLLSVGPDYAKALVRTLFEHLQSRRRVRTA